MIAGYLYYLEDNLAFVYGGIMTIIALLLLLIMTFTPKERSTQEI
ncbi:MAG: hypothetical protein ACW991_03330 [Candidatus Hodarchaeales archaeon]|jgi:hypothetical protein